MCIMNKIDETLLNLIKLGIGHKNDIFIPKDIDWNNIFILSQQHGVSAIVFDGINLCYKNGNGINLDFNTKIEWIGLVNQIESSYEIYVRNLESLARFYNKNGLKMMVLKGYGLSKNYPVPSHRPCGDLDIYLESMRKLTD